MYTKATCEESGKAVSHPECPCVVFLSVHSEMGQLSQRSNDTMREILEGSTYYYMPEPTPDMQMQPRTPNTNLSQIAGYLMIRW